MGNGCSDCCKDTNTRFYVFTKDVDHLLQEIQVLKKRGVVIVIIGVNQQEERVCVECLEKTKKEFIYVSDVYRIKTVHKAVEPVT